MSKLACAFAHVQMRAWSTQQQPPFAPPAAPCETRRTTIPLSRDLLRTTYKQRARSAKSKAVSANGISGPRRRCCHTRQVVLNARYEDRRDADPGCACRCIARLDQTKSCLTPRLAVHTMCVCAPGGQGWAPLACQIWVGLFEGAGRKARSWTGDRKSLGPNRPHGARRHMISSRPELGSAESSRNPRDRCNPCDPPDSMGLTPPMGLPSPQRT